MRSCLEKPTEYIPTDLFQPLFDVLKEVVQDLDALHGERRKKSLRLLSLSEAARRLGVSRNGTLHCWIRDRRIAAVKVGGRLKISVAEVERVSTEGIGGAGRHAPRR